MDVRGMRIDSEEYYNTNFYNRLFLRSTLVGCFSRLLVYLLSLSRFSPVLIALCIGVALIVVLMLFFAAPLLSLGRLADRHPSPLGAAVCGNGRMEASERCDDGNTVAHDGCTGCLVDAGFRCGIVAGEQEPSVCTRAFSGSCGDGLIDAIEQCDDGNVRDTDGCSHLCTVELGFSCSGVPSYCGVPLPVCGNGIIESGEDCDDANIRPRDGCTPRCRLQEGWRCGSVPSECWVEAASS